MSETGPDSQAEVAAALGAAYPDPTVRQSLLTFLAQSIELAHSGAPGSWEITFDSSQRLIRFNVGMIVAIDLVRGKAAISLVSEAIPAALREALKPRGGGDFKSLEGVAWYWIDPSALVEHAAALRGPHDDAVRRAAAACRQSPRARAHEPAVLSHLDQVVGRQLPRPQYEAATGRAAMPSLSQLWPIYQSRKPVALHVRHNLDIWRSIHGAFEVSRNYQVPFDPRLDYWYKTERRLLVAYSAKRLEGCYAPASILRSLSFKLFRHFELARQNGRFGEVALADRHSRGLRGLIADAETVARELPSMPEFGALADHWPRLDTESAAQDVLAFLAIVREGDGLDPFEPAFFKRIPWFAYISAENLEELAPRQMFFAAFYTLFTSTNSYKVGGGLAFASILQNNPYDELLSYAARWAAGEPPSETGFNVWGREDKRDRSHYAPAVELFGFLNLDKQPFFNSAVEAAYGGEDEETGIQRTRRIGDATRAHLASDIPLTAALATEFHRALSALDAPSPIVMEGVRGQSAKAADVGGTERVDVRISRELVAGAARRAQALTRDQAAATMFHILLDSVLYQAPEEEAVVPALRTTSAVHEPSPRAEARGTDRHLDLPPSLTGLANDALAYLKAGFHVLLAGAPGTGKTTLAQLVGHAWDRDLAVVPNRISVAEAPLTTVANSAWAPFHTIGGILPDEDGKYRVQKGVFMDPNYSNENEWRLLPRCVVLDEMNRADLDRCIGELYPLLTHSVEFVTPAGIPGVGRIGGHERFRLVSTVNDATLDDIVFPISEGLARRFLRLELRGALEQEVVDFLRLRSGEGDTERLSVAQALVAAFFARCGEHERLQDSELGEHLPFGVGYFSLLGSWAGRQLSMSKAFEERDLRDQALEVLKTSLRAATRDVIYAKVFAGLKTAGSLE